jgi:hypothetical protein
MRIPRLKVKQRCISPGTSLTKSQEREGGIPADVVSDRDARFTGRFCLS